MNFEICCLQSETVEKLLSMRGRLYQLFQTARTRVLLDQWLWLSQSLLIKSRRRQSEKAATLQPFSDSLSAAVFAHPLILFSWSSSPTCGGSGPPPPSDTSALWRRSKKQSKKQSDPRKRVRIMCLWVICFSSLDNTSIVLDRNQPNLVKISHLCVLWLDLCKIELSFFCFVLLFFNQTPAAAPASWTGNGTRPFHLTGETLILLRHRSSADGIISKICKRRWSHVALILGVLPLPRLPWLSPSCSLSVHSCRGSERRASPPDPSALVSLPPFSDVSTWASLALLPAVNSCCWYR